MYPIVCSLVVRIIAYFLLKERIKSFFYKKVNKMYTTSDKWEG